MEQILQVAGHCDVLLFGSMGDIAQVAEASLKSHGLDIVSIPFPQNICRDRAGYERELFKAIRRFCPKVVIPVGNILTAASLKDKLPSGVIIAAGNPEHIALLDSKVESYSLASSLGIPQPCRFSSPEEIRQYPVIFKREKSFGGSGVYKPRTRGALEHLMVHEVGKFLIEEYIEGTDYSVDCINFGKEFHYSAYRCISSRGQGPSITRECVAFPLLGEYARRILEHLGYRGVCGMDFRVDSSGNAWFLECNPRFCGGLKTQIEHGFDIPWILLNSVTEATKKNPIFADGGRLLLDVVPVVSTERRRRNSEIIENTTNAPVAEAITYSDRSRDLI